MFLHFPPRPAWGRVRKWVFRFVAGYLVLLFLSYLLLSQARADWEDTAVYWEEASSLAVDVNRTASLQEAIRSVGERPAPPEDGDFEPDTRSLAVWDVLGTWVSVRESADRLSIAVMGQLEWADAVLQAESRMNGDTAN